MRRVTVDNQVFKFQDSRVAALASGRLSVQQFVHTIFPGDWFIMLGNTVYALTEDEYYAAQRVITEAVLTKEQFQEVLKNAEQLFQGKDLEEVITVRGRKAHCSKCQYNSYKQQVSRIVKRYPALSEKYQLSPTKEQVAVYPKTTGEFEIKVSKLFPKFFNEEPYERNSCLDCVEKHVSMAYVKACESEQGYSEHLVLAIANLEEAFEESPKDCEHLRELLMFCIAKSKSELKCFVPIGTLLYLIEVARRETQDSAALDQNQPAQDFALELSEQMKEDLKNLPVLVKAPILKDLEKLLSVEYSEKYEHREQLYQGLLGNIADNLVAYCPAVSNVLRNRRLMFKAAPTLVCNTEYDCKDLKEALLSQS